MSIPHPGYLDDCAPTLALRPGEQRRFDFQCAGPGIFNETESSWGPPDAWDDVRIKIADPNVRTCGLCGCIFSLTFTTSTAYGELVAGPGPRCGASRWYWGRIQRPRNPAYPEAWSIMLGDGLPPMKMIATYK